MKPASLPELSVQGGGRRRRAEGGGRGRAAVVIWPLIALTVTITGRPLTYDKDPREETAVSPSNSRPFPSVNVAEAGELELGPDSFSSDSDIQLPAMPTEQRSHAKKSRPRTEEPSLLVAEATRTVDIRLLWISDSL